MMKTNFLRDSLEKVNAFEPKKEVTPFVARNKEIQF